MAEGIIRSGGDGSRYIPDELLDKILVSLPVKSLIRFQLVCKTWQSMINARSFIDSYGRRGDLKSSLTLRTIRLKTLKRIMAPGLRDQPITMRDYRVLGPLSNGIYCFVSLPHEHSYRFSILPLRIALFNPATRAYKFTNPFPREFLPLLARISVRLFCQVHFGFGNVSSSPSDYRVVVLIKYDGGCFLVLVYDGQRGEWRKIVDYVLGEINDVFNIPGRRIISVAYPLEVCPQRLFKGCYHWMARCEDRSYNALSFSFDDESFKLIAGPPTAPRRTLGDVFVLHHHLTFIYSSFVYLRALEKRYVNVDVWMMMEYGVQASWTKIYAIDTDFVGNFWRLHGIRYSLLKSGHIRIKRLYLKGGLKQQIISDRASDDKICCNTPGISIYFETLECP